MFMQETLYVSKLEFVKQLAKQPLLPHIKIRVHNQ
jgi:hypothetical protein